MLKFFQMKRIQVITWHQFHKKKRKKRIPREKKERILCRQRWRRSRTMRHRRDTPFQRKSFGDITNRTDGVSEKIQ